MRYPPNSKHSFMAINRDYTNYMQIADAKGKRSQPDSLSEIESFERRINHLHRFRAPQLIDSSFKNFSLRQAPNLRNCCNASWSSRSAMRLIG